MRTNYEQSAWESTLLWVWSKQCGSSGDPQGLIQIQVRVIEDVPEPIYDLSISLRPIRNSNDRNSALALLQCIAETRRSSYCACCIIDFWELCSLLSWSP